jgi:hypothetical protein
MCKPVASSSLRYLIVCTASVVALAGCRGGSTVSGTITFPKNVQPTDSEPVQIGFVPEVKGQKGSVALFSRADNTFVCRDLPPGKYKISVNITTGPVGKVDKKSDAPKHHADVTQLNKTFDPGTTKLTYEVTSEGSQSIAIDLEKKTVTKQ